MKWRIAIAAIVALLVCSAIAAGVIWGSDSDALKRITTTADWLILLTTLVVLLALAALGVRIMNGLLRFFFGWMFGDGVLIMGWMAYVVLAWLGVMLLSSYAWAWIRQAG